MSFRPETTVAIEAVRRALDLAARRVGANEVAIKQGRDIVTATDMAAESAIRQVLSETIDLPVIGEEQGGEPPDDGSPYWLVDPICGTRNYASGTPMYCVNVALVEGDTVAAAVVGDPSTDQLLVAEAGHGTWAVNGGSRHRLTTSDAARTIVIEDGKSGGQRREQAADFFARVIRADRWDFRSLGTTLSLPYVAAGRVCAYVVFLVPALHAAAGTLLVREAGGVVSDVDGRPWTLRSDSLIGCANADIHGDLLALMRGTQDS